VHKELLGGRLRKGEKGGSWEEWVLDVRGVSHYAGALLERTGTQGIGREV